MMKQSSGDKPIKRPTYPEGVLPGRDFDIVEPSNGGTGKPRSRKRPKNGGEVEDLDPLRERRPGA